LAVKTRCRAARACYCAVEDLRLHSSTVEGAAGRPAVRSTDVAPREGPATARGEATLGCRWRVGEATPQRRPRPRIRPGSAGDLVGGGQLVGMWPRWRRVFLQEDPALGRPRGGGWPSRGRGLRWRGATGGRGGATSAPREGQSSTHVVGADHRASDGGEGERGEP
jgi:hypothetical protein